MLTHLLHLHHDLDKVTVGGASIPRRADLRRMRQERHAKLQAQLDAQDVGALVLLGTNAVSYATGAAAPAADSSRAAILRAVAVVVRGDPAPHVFTPYAEGAPEELPADHLHGPLYPDLDDAPLATRSILTELLATCGRLAIDDVPYPLRPLLGGAELVPAAPIMAPAKIVKTADELACIHEAQRINELAMVDAQRALRPGVRQTDLSACFLRRAYELGIDTNAIDPIWQVMPPYLAAGPWTTHGSVAFPTPTTDRFLREGDVLWVDSGVTYQGYASDFGRTWVVAADPRPTARQRAQFERWCDVMSAVLELCKPGVSSLELTRAATAANEGVKPWIEHFYLGHGVGTESAEMPLVGTDLGDAFDEQQMLTPGTVLVLEPAIWDDGAAGYRSEEVIAITDDGWVALSDHPYDPFGEAP